MHIDVITIGDELLLGYTIDTNAAHLAQVLAGAGFDVERRVTVGDRADHIAAAVGEALDRTGAVITTGGLGPTSDDLTKPAIAAVFGRDMHLESRLLDEMRERWKARGWPGEFPSANRHQAMVPAGAAILVNRHGSAPGIWLEDTRGRWVAMLPGVPREMRGMLADELLPRLQARAGATTTVIRSRTIRTTGVAESALADAIGDPARFAGARLAYLPGWEGTDLRLTARDAAPGRADEVLRRAGQELLGILGDAVYGEDAVDLAAVAVAAFRTRSLRVAVAESCTGGMLGMRLTATPGASDVFVGGIIAYDDAVKRSPLGVEAELIATHGAVSESVARAMAEGARARLMVDVGIAITGVAGPGGGTPAKPVGTVWVAVARAHGTVAVGSVLAGDREEIRRRATQMALNLARTSLSPLPPRATAVGPHTPSHH